MDSIGEDSLSWCFHCIDVMEIIHAQYLKGFLLSQSRKKCTLKDVFSVLGNLGRLIHVQYVCIRVHVFRKLFKVSCSKGCAHNPGGLKIRQSLYEYSWGGIAYL